MASSPDFNSEVGRGAAAAATFIAGAAQFGMAYAVSALAAGFSPLETVLFSVLACSGSAQMASVGLAASGTGPLAIGLAALGLSLRHVLYGLSLATWLPSPSRPPTPLLAATVFDEGFGLATREAAAGRGSAGFLVIFPLSFLALLLPLIRTRRDALVAAIAGAGAVLLRGPLGPGPAVVVSIAGAVAIGAVLDRGAAAP